MSQKRMLLDTLKQLENDQKINRLQLGQNNAIGLHIFSQRIALSMQLTALKLSEKHKNFFKGRK